MDLGREQRSGEGRTEDRADPRSEPGGEEDAPEQYTSNTPQDLSQQSVLLEMEDEDGDDQPLGADERLDRLSAEDNAEAVMDPDADPDDDPDPLITPPLYGQWHALTRRLLVDVRYFGRLSL